MALFASRQTTEADSGRFPTTPCVTDEDEPRGVIWAKRLHAIRHKKGDETRSFLISRSFESACGKGAEGLKERLGRKGGPSALEQPSCLATTCSLLILIYP